MPDFEVTVTKVFTITARNQEQADERGEEVLDHLMLAYGKPGSYVFDRIPRWLGDEQSSEVTTQES